MGLRFRSPTDLGSSGTQLCKKLNTNTLPQTNKEPTKGCFQDYCPFMGWLYGVLYNPII